MEDLLGRPAKPKSGKPPEAAGRKRPLEVASSAQDGATPADAPAEARKAAQRQRRSHPQALRMRRYVAEALRPDAACQQPSSRLPAAAGGEGHSARPAQPLPGTAAAAQQQQQQQGAVALTPLEQGIPELDAVPDTEEALDATGGAGGQQPAGSASAAQPPRPLLQPRTQESVLEGAESPPGLPPEAGAPPPLQRAAGPRPAAAAEAPPPRLCGAPARLMAAAGGGALGLGAAQAAAPAAGPQSPGADAPFEPPPHGHAPAAGGSPPAPAWRETVAATPEEAERAEPPELALVQQQQQQQQQQQAAGLAPAEQLAAAAESEGEEEATADARGTAPAIFTQPPARAQQEGGSPAAGDSLEMRDYLAPSIVAVYHASRLQRLYPWQAACLNLPGVRSEARNLVYCAPTGAGKSAVAEVLTLCRWDATGKAALYVLPYVALCEQKVAALSRLLQPLGRKVQGCYGNLGKLRAIDLRETAAVVCTIEKANLLVNRLLEEGTLSDLIATVVVDELHMVADDERGYLLELLLTKLRFQQRRALLTDEAGAGGEAGGSGPGCGLGSAGGAGGLQLVGMSATMPNAGQVAAWLGAALFETSFRPVPLDLFLKSGDDLLRTDLSLARRLAPPPGWHAADGDGALLLAAESMGAGHSVLVFCGTKRHCELQAELAARLLSIPDRSGQRPALLERLRRVSASAGLVAAFERGAAFHTSSLSREEREVVEAGFLAGAVRLVAATTTLAAGVNLPARRVLLKHHWVGRPSHWLSSTQLQQMAGRAGRAGLDTAGEVVLLCPRGADPAPFAALMRAEARRVDSCLHPERRGMARALMEVIASGVVSSNGDIAAYVQSTLAATQDASDKKETVVGWARAALHWLRDRGFLAVSHDPGEPRGALLWQALELGSAACAAGLAPEHALMVQQDLAQAQERYVMRADLHLTFLVTPVTEDVLSLVSHEPRSQWRRFAEVYSAVDRDARRRAVATACGIEFDFIARLRTLGLPARDDAHQVRICRRFFAALALLDLINVRPPPPPHTHTVATFCMVGCCRSEAGARPRMGALRAGLAARLACSQPSLRGCLLGLPGWDPALASVPASAALRRGTGTGPRTRVRGPQERPPQRVEADFGLPPRALDSLRDRAAGFAGMVAAFCARLKYTQLEQLVASFQDRVQHGVMPELVALAAIQGVRGARARQLHTAGLRTVRDVAESPADSLAAVFARGSAGGPDAGHRQAALRVRKAAKRLLHEQAAEFLAQAGIAAELPPRSQESQEEAAAASPSQPDAAAVEAPAKGAGGQPGAAEAAARAAERQPAVQLLSRPEQAPALAELLAAAREAAGFAFDLAVSERMARGSAALPPAGQAKASHYVRSLAVATPDRLWVVLLRPEFAPALAELLALPVLKVCFRLKPQLAALAALGEAMRPHGWPELRVAGEVVDVRVAQFLLTPGRAAVCDSPELEDALRQERRKERPLELLGPLLDEHDARAAIAARFTSAQLLADSWAGGVRAAAASAVFERQRPLLEAAGLMRPLLAVEMPLVRVLLAVERTGVCLDPRVYEAACPPLRRRLAELDRLMEEAAGEAVVPSSSDSVRKLLFKTLRLKVPTSRTTRTGKPRTDAEALAEIDHPVAGYIIEYRQVEKLLGDLDSYLRTQQPACAAAPAGLRLVSAAWLQTSSETGRVTVEGPNLQCVAKPRRFRVPTTQLDGAREFELNLRAAFVPRPGWLLLAGDYRQQELRLMAHLSGDARLCGLLREGRDPFACIAADWHACAPEQVSDATRNLVKQLVYGLMYGMGPATLARKLECSIDAAKGHLQGLHERYPDLAKWSTEVVAACRRRPDCSVATLGGRRRQLRQIAARDGHWAAAAERQARATVVQGSAADVAKRAMLRLTAAAAERLPGRCNLLLMIHDELVIEVPRADLHTGAALLREAMAGAWQLRVPLEVQLAAGASWGSLQPYEPPSSQE